MRQEELLQRMRKSVEKVPRCGGKRWGRGGVDQAAFDPGLLGAMNIGRFFTWGGLDDLKTQLWRWFSNNIWTEEARLFTVGM